MAAGARDWAAVDGRAPGPARDAARRAPHVVRGGGPPRPHAAGPIRRTASRTQRNAFRARIDREAASVILQDELDARRSAAPSGEVGPARTAVEDRQEDR